MKKTAFICFCLFSALMIVSMGTTAIAGEVDNVKITRIGSYTSTSAGYNDIPLTLSVACPGAVGGTTSWFLPTASFSDNKNSMNAFSLLLAAFMSGKTVKIGFAEGKQPNFSSRSDQCEIHSVTVNS